MALRGFVLTSLGVISIACSGEAIAADSCRNVAPEELRRLSDRVIETYIREPTSLKAFSDFYGALHVNCQKNDKTFNRQIASELVRLLAIPLFRGFVLAELDRIGAAAAEVGQGIHEAHLRVREENAERRRRFPDMLLERGNFERSLRCLDLRLNEGIDSPEDCSDLAGMREDAAGD